MLNDEQIVTNFWGETVILILSTLKFWLLTQMNLKETLLIKRVKPVLKRPAQTFQLKFFD